MLDKMLVLFVACLSWALAKGAGVVEVVRPVLIAEDLERTVSRIVLACWLSYSVIRYVGLPLARLLLVSVCGMIAATKVSVWMCVRVVRFLSSPVRVLYVNHRLRRKVMHRVRAKSMVDVALTGELKFDVNGPYILIVVNGSERQVRLSQGDLGCLAYSSAGMTRGSEALLPGAVLVPSSPVKGQVFFTLAGKTVGSGFRTSHFGYDALVTAFHVAKGLGESGGDWSISLGDREVVMDREMREHMTLTKWSTDLDVAIFKMPPAIWSVLGVKSAKVSKTPLGPSISTTGVTSGDMVRSYGVVTKVTSNFGFKHTASTERGWSGAPLVSESGAVIGMHVRGFGIPPRGYTGHWAPHNMGLSFDWAFTPKVVRGAESDVNIFAFAHRDDMSEWDDEEERRITLHEEAYERHMNTDTNGGYGDWEGEQYDWRGESFQGFRWSDEDFDFDTSPFESCFPLAPPTGAVKSVGTTSPETKPSLVPAALSSTSSAPISAGPPPSPSPPATPPRKSRRKSRKSKGVVGQQQRGRESNVPLGSTPNDTSTVNPSMCATPIVTASPIPGSDALSKELRELLGAMLPAAALMSHEDLRTVVSSIPSIGENLEMALSWLSGRMQRNAARALKKSEAASART
jgi:hypothetical protein